MTRLCAALLCGLSLLVPQTLLAVSSSPRPASPTTLAARAAYMYVFSQRPPAGGCAPERRQEAAAPAPGGQETLQAQEPQGSEERQPAVIGKESAEAESRDKDVLDIDALALKLAPRQLKRHGIGFELGRLLTLGDVGRGNAKAYPIEAFFACSRRLARSCLLDDRPDGAGFEFLLGYPADKAARLVLGMQAEEGGRLGRSNVRSVLGLSVAF